MNHDIFVRAHTVSSEPQAGQVDPKPRWPLYVLAFDTETTIDSSQALTFGAYRFCELQSSGNYACTEEGLLHPDNPDPQSLAILNEYTRLAKPSNQKDGPQKLKLRSRSEFVEKVLWQAIQANAMVVGFNLPFDLSRIAAAWTPARNGGWSLIMSLRRSKKTRKIVPNPDRPRIRVTAKDSKSAFITLMRPRIKEEWPNARFLDVHTLALALFGESYTLDGLCALLKIDGKSAHEPSGKVSFAEIDYCRNDVRITVTALNALKREFDLHPIDLQPDHAYSPASIAKAYLRSMGIVPPTAKFKVPHRVLGIAMQSYYGGRAECRIRNSEVPVVHTDFVSQYPTVNTLLGNFPVLTAKSIEFADATGAVRQLLANVTLDVTFDPDFWKQLQFFALVRPDDNIFPVRTVYNGQTQNIGVNRLSSKQPVWFAGPDVIAAALLSGKVPRILKAIRMVPHGLQPELTRTNLRGMVPIDPKTDDLFRKVIEQRKRPTTDKSLSFFLKILANAGSYGLFVELTPEKQRKPLATKVFSGEKSFSVASQTIEQHGKWYFPPLAALITAGGRLLLAMLERSVTDKGGTYLFCDTDSLCIVASKNSGKVDCPGGPLKALSWSEVNAIARRFAALNPYDPNLIQSILKIEDINFDAKQRQRQLYGYAISAKRYVLYERRGNAINILDPKAHGLGYLFAPKAHKNDKETDWTFEAWEWLLRGALGLSRKRPAWLNVPAMMRIVMSTPHVLHRLKDIARPYNFVLCPLIDSVAGYPANVDPERFTLVAPYTKDRNRLLSAECINVYDGKKYQLALQQTTKFDKVIPQTMEYVLRLYLCHPESKSLAPDGSPCNGTTRGLLGRASITAEKVRYIGKETDRTWEQGESLTLLSFAPTEYGGSCMVVADSALRKQFDKYSLRELIRTTGFSQHTLQAIRSGQKVRARTLQRLRSCISQKEKQANAIQRPKP